MGADFDKAFDAILKKKAGDVAAEKKQAREHRLELGNTDRGRGQVAPKHSVRDEGDERPAHVWNIREIPPYRGHAHGHKSAARTRRRSGGQWQ